jgi:hypothetical protein
MHSNRTSKKPSQTEIATAAIVNAKEAAERGKVTAVDTYLREIPTRALRTLEKQNPLLRQELSDIFKSARINAIPDLLEVARFEAKSGCVTDCDQTLSQVEQYAREALVVLHKDQLQEITGLKTLAREKAIKTLVKALPAHAKHQRILAVDRSIALIEQYCNDAGIAVKPKSLEVVKDAFKKVRRRVVDSALTEPSHPDRDKETITRYVDEADLKLTKFQRLTLKSL